MSDYLTRARAVKCAQALEDAIPGASVRIHERRECWVSVQLPDGTITTITGEHGDIAGDIADLKALAEGRQP